MKFGLVEEPGFVATLEFGLGPGDPVDPAPHQHIALGPEFLRLEIVVEPVGEHRLPARAQLDLARALDDLLAFVPSSNVGAKVSPASRSDPVPGCLSALGAAAAASARS
jgi:hypothetical protein